MSVRSPTRTRPSECRKPRAINNFCRLFKHLTNRLPHTVSPDPLHRKVLLLPGNTARTTNPAAQDRSERTAEVSRIFMNALAQDGELNADDRRYIARLVAQNTNLTQQQAEARVNEVYENTRQRLEELEASAREAVETAREASAYTSLWLSVALLIGAFVASLAATWGGRQRDY